MFLDEIIRGGVAKDFADLNGVLPLRRDKSPFAWSGAKNAQRLL